MVQDPNSRANWYADIPMSARWPTVTGFAILGGAIFGFAAWANTAPMDGAVISRGSFVVTGQNKIIQHLEGGIIEKILVREGDRVDAGQTLIKLGETGHKAKLRRLSLRYARLLAARARLNAQSRKEDKLVFPEILLKQDSDPDIRHIISVQKFAFETHLNTMRNDIDILERSIASFRHRVTGAEAQLAAARTQLKHVKSELEGKAKLYGKGLLGKPQILAVRRAEAQITGEIGKLIAQADDGRERIRKAEQQIVRVRNMGVEKAVDELHQTEAEMQDVRERITAARDVLKRVNIAAPVAGIVIKMRYHTPGGVIEPGNDILELLPLGDELIIQAHIRPQDIDNVKRGQDAIIRLTALNQRITPMVPGKVIYVSADTLPNEEQRTKDDVYIARVKLDKFEVEKMANFQATPGMPVEIYIKTGERTFFEYLLQPVFDSMQRAFRES